MKHDPFAPDFALPRLEPLDSLLVGDATERAYRRGDALEQRRKLMVEWADFVAGNTEALAIAA
ncbi:MAG: hypothetical protein ABL879_06225 [Devosia sp.]